MLVGAIAEGVALYFLLNMLLESGAVRKNYLGNDIPVSVGISFPVSLILVFLFYALIQRYDFSFHIYLIGIISICFLGFIDDMLGQRDTLGFKGHFGALFKGRLTTGGLKALGGGIIAFFIALSLSGLESLSNGWVDILLNTLIIALFTNMLNLLDLRPGRAIKGYLFFLLLIILMAVGRVNWVLITPLLGIILVYFPVDLKARAMMGDAGSNVLGLTLGYYSIIFLSLPYRIAVLIFLIAMHIYTEKFSLTWTIERVPLLRLIDHAGRSRENG
jgi:UDP-N-acetylmuramyl pentapeptide phosphotransferase/UDP-N-acetylglucosamine-1-phosphate transferase